MSAFRTGRPRAVVPAEDLRQMLVTLKIGGHVMSQMTFDAAARRVLRGSGQERLVSGEGANFVELIFTERA